MILGSMITWSLNRQTLEAYARRVYGELGEWPV